MDQEERMTLAWLCSIPWVGSRTPQRLLDFFGSAREVWKAPEGLLRKCVPESAVSELLAHRAAVSPDKVWERMEKNKIRAIAPCDSQYPPRLAGIPDPPPVLYVCGTLPDPGKPVVAIVGARECSTYGKTVARQLALVLGQARIPVVSGMARGIDGISQEAALTAGGSSIAVLGCGVDICYPEDNRRLYERLKTEGCILSPYGPGVMPRPNLFPPRNRIVSGLSDALVVVEARQKSGTLITVDMALEQGREVYAVPGRITDRLSDGCNGLLGQGAQVFLSPEIFLRELGTLCAERPATSGTAASAVIPSRVPEALRARRKRFTGKEAADAPNLDPEALQVLRVLELTPKSAEELLPILPGDFTAMQVQLLLTQLTLEGYAVQVSPGQFCRSV
ncbi:MAG: DNA-processing protein DprA [Lachnospiraceae bacterium]|nr:DNA-processing protein DprA [Lachnospiraceae bacterium]